MKLAKMKKLTGAGDHIIKPERAGIKFFPIYRSSSSKENILRLIIFSAGISWDIP